MNSILIISSQNDYQITLLNKVIIIIKTLNSLHFDCTTCYNLYNTIKVVMIELLNLVSNIVSTCRAVVQTP